MQLLSKCLQQSSRESSSRRPLSFAAFMLAFFQKSVNKLRQVKEPPQCGKGTWSETMCDTSGIARWRKVMWADIGCRLSPPSHTTELVAKDSECKTNSKSYWQKLGIGAKHMAECSNNGDTLLFYTWQFRSSIDSLWAGILVELAIL